MTRTFFLVLFSYFLSGCELIVIGTKSDTNLVRNNFDYNQKTPLGTFYLFKAEIDSNNVPAASNLVASPKGEKYLAYQRYEQFYDICRVKRMIAKREITDMFTDSVSDSKFRYNLIFDFRRKLTFTCSKIDNYWYITEMGNYD